MKGVLKTLDHMLSTSIDLKKLTQDLIDVLKDIVIYKNTEDLSLLFVLHKSDIQQIIPYILVEEAFERLISSWMQVVIMVNRLILQHTLNLLY